MDMRRVAWNYFLRRMPTLHNSTLKGFDAMITIQDDWEFNVLGIYNFTETGRFDDLFKFIRDNHSKYREISSRQVSIAET